MDCFVTDAPRNDIELRHCEPKAKQSIERVP